VKRKFLNAKDFFFFLNSFESVSYVYICVLYMRMCVCIVVIFLFSSACFFFRSLATFTRKIYIYIYIYARKKFHPSAAVTNGVEREFRNTVDDDVVWECKRRKNV